MKQLILCVFLCVATSLAAQNNKPVQDAMANYDYETAIALIEKESPTPVLLLQKGKAQKALAMNAQALATFRQLIAEDPQQALAHIEAAECCKALAKYKEALDYYRQALDLNPNNKYVRLQYISLLCNQNQFQEALGESSVMAETDSSAVVLHLQAQSLEGMQQILPAMGCYHVIQDKYPDDYLAAAKLGSLYCASGGYEYAIEATEKYRQIDSTNMVVNRQNAVAYCLAQDYPTAIDRYRYLISQGDSTLLTTYYMGVCYYASERYYDAYDMLSIAVQQSPKDPNLLYYLGRSCAKTSWKQEGIEHLKRAIELSQPSDSAMARLYTGLTDCYKMAGNPREQIEAIKEHYKYEPTKHRLIYDMATVYAYQLKDKRNAERCLESFLKTQPKEGAAKTPELNEKGEVELGLTNYYNAARNWLEDLQKERKKEEFFRDGGAPQATK